MGLLARVVLACAGCGAPAAARQPLPYPGAGDVGYVLIQEPDEGYFPVVNLVRRAARSVRITMYEFDFLGGLRILRRTGRLTLCRRERLKAMAPVLAMPAMAAAVSDADPP